jgi:two-component system chemotaxis response regulator CheY
VKVLLVDDSGTMRSIQKRCLNKIGIEDIVEAEDGRRALEAFEKQKFDIVLSDWNMPNMDGLTLLTEIRKRNQAIPVIMITTEAERSRVISAIQAGCSDYLTKPFTVDVLQQKLEKWIVPATA